MSHPPPSKKRYYYSNGGPSHMMRYGNTFPKKNYVGNGVYGVSSSSGTSSAAGAAANEPARPSRYDPSSPSRPVSSRNPSSRYNPEAEFDKAAFAEETHAKSSGSRYSGSRYNPSLMQQVRPRSMGMSKKDLSYSYPVSGSNVLGNGSVNSASGYYSRSNKWRSHSATNMNSDHYEGFSGSTTRPPFWKSQKSNFTATPTQASGPKRTTPSPTIPSAGRFNRYSGSTSHRESSDESEPISENSESTTKNENPHSLGSSLINSVVETTRKVEQQHATDHKRINIERATSLRSQEAADASEDDEVKERSLEPAKEVAKPLKKTSEMWSSYDTSSKEQTIPAIEDSKKSLAEEEPIFHKEPSKIYDNYEFIYEPDLLKTDLRRLPKHEPIVSYSIPIEPLDKCIFPLTRAETRLWELKNQPRDKIIENQRHLLQHPIKTIDSYPFIKQNILIHKQAVRPTLRRQIATIKKFEYLKKLQLQKQFSILQATWVKKCEKMDEMSRKMRKEELDHKKQEEIEEQEREIDDRKLAERNSRASGSSRRRNRADFVDDAEIENVLLQIDPDYKHHQQAANIPPMISNPVEKYSLKLKNVNNLVTDKEFWASRIIHDGVDTFTKNEHDLFVEGYLTYPKKFGKISQFMGGLRSPEECVLHYYRTKNTVGYKRLLNDKNKRRQKSATAKRRKKKERSNEVDTDLSNSTNEADVSTINTDIIADTAVVTAKGQENMTADEKPFKQMEQVVIKMPEAQDTITDSNDELPQKEKEITEHTAVIEGQKEEQQPSEDDSGEVANRKSYPVSPIPEQSDVGALIPRKRVSDGNDMPSDAEKTILDEHCPTDGSVDIQSGQLLRGSQYADQPGDKQRPDIANEDNLQRKRHKSNSDHKSSYWSVKEANLFPDLLRQYGSQWSLISQKLGTKSTTMVRNYYQRNAAQLGWKSIVEEADFRRNATSSGSVQQSQILIQAEQNSLQGSNGIPPQQRPALGFFSNHPSSEKNLPTSSQLYAPESTRDAFSQAVTPSNALPPPRLPSIQLPGTASAESTNVESSSQLPKSSPSPTENVLSKQEKSAGAVSSIMNILNADEKKQSHAATPAIKSTGHIPHFSQLQHNQLTSAVRPSVGNVVVQELQNSSSSSPDNHRSSSISSLLNPESQLLSRAQPQPALAQRALDKGPLPCPPPLSQPQRANFNFAVDPLGALAAIASESLLPTQASQTKGDQGNET